MNYKTPNLLLFICLSFLLSGIALGEPCTEPGSITRVRNTSIGRSEYVIFDIKNREDGAAPEYEVETAVPPFTDYSGEETYTIAGGKYKRIVFRSINWMCEIPQKTRLPRTAVKGVKLLSSFEGIVEYAVGYRSRSRYIATYSYEAGSVTKVVMKFRK